MLTIVAAVIALTPAPDARPARADAPKVFVAPRTQVLRERPMCSAAGRLQTDYEAALLFREQDRRTARLRKLIEMPMAEACLVERAR